MKISVAIITYNQENTIRQTIDSILSQKGEFELEIVIGEDCGKDKTFYICKEYETKYPNIVRVLNNTHNLGIMANYARTILACKGDLISNIAGDDFYCDDHALEKQMTYMNTHPEVGVLASNGYLYYVKQDKLVEGLNKPTIPENDKTKEFFFNSNFRGGVCFTPIGLMVRSALFKHIDFEEIIRRKLPFEDDIVQPILSQLTHFACLSDLLVTYRIYKESATFISFNNPKYLEYHKGLMNTRRYLNELFPEDACFTEKDMLEYEFYKEYLLHLHFFHYKQAKLLISKYKPLIEETHKYNMACKTSKTIVHFCVFALIKEMKYKKELSNRTSNG